MNRAIIKCILSCVPRRDGSRVSCVRHRQPSHRVCSNTGTDTGTGFGTGTGTGSGTGTSTRGALAVSRVELTVVKSVAEGAASSCKRPGSDTHPSFDATDLLAEKSLDACFPHPLLHLPTGFLRSRKNHAASGIGWPDG